MADVEIECPRCGNVETEEIEDLATGSRCVDCSECHAVLDVGYTVSIEIAEVAVIETRPAEFECPECGCS